MRLLYIVGTGSKWNNNELRYSLRSVARYGVNVSGITIVGNLPAFVTGVRHIPASDPYDLKADNAWHKLKIACAAESEPFVLMNDDFFLLQPTDFATLPYYYDGTLDAYIDNYPRSSPYVRVLEHTRDVLKHNARKALNYALHVPMRIEPEQLAVLLPLFGERPGVSLRCLYGNLFADDSREMKDVKLNGVPVDALPGLLQGLPFFSIGDKFLSETGKKYLSGLYPQPSPYEQT